LAGETTASVYFPPDAFSSDTNSHTSKVNWYTKHLVAMGEPSLLEYSKDDLRPTYRFLWLRTFHEPIAIRLTVQKDGSGTLHGIVLDGKGGYDPGVIKDSTNVEVRAKDVSKFLQRLLDCDFWDRSNDGSKLGAWHRNPEDNTWLRAYRGGYDGAQWIIEAVSSNRYNVFERWSPESGAFRDACLELINMSGLKVDPIY